MKANTLRFGVARVAVFSVVLAAAAVYAGRAHAEGIVPAKPTPELVRKVSAEAGAQLKAELNADIKDAVAVHAVTAQVAIDPVRADLLSKVAASAFAAPRGFVLVMPAALVQAAL